MLRIKHPHEDAYVVSIVLVIGQAAAVALARVSMVPVVVYITRCRRMAK